MTHRSPPVPLGFRRAAISDSYGRPIMTDAFGRVRVSDVRTIFDNSQAYKPGNLSFSTLTSGSGIVHPHSQVRASTTLSVGPGPGRAVRRSRRRFRYQPGKSQQIFVSGVASAIGAGATVRMGSYDDKNGFFLELSEAGAAFVLRSSASGSVVEERVRQGSWSVDQSPTANFQRMQVLAFDYEWLAGGSVRCGALVEGVTVLWHEFHHANEALGAYTSTPNLPVSWEVETTQGEASVETVCCSVGVEGGVDPTGLLTSAITPSAITLSSDWRALIRIRLRDTHEGVHVEPTDLVVTASANSSVEYALAFNPAVPTPSGAASWSPACTCSAVEVDYTESGIVTGWEHRMRSGLALAVPTTPEVAYSPGVTSILALGQQLDGTMDQFAILARAVSGNPTARAVLTWRELA